MGMPSQPPSHVFPTIDVFSSMDASFHVINKHWKAMVKRQGKYIVVLSGLFLGLWLVAMTVLSLLDFSSSRRFGMQVTTTILIAIVGTISLGLLSMFLFLVNAAFTSKIIQGESVTYEEMLKKSKKRLRHYINYIFFLFGYGLVLVTLGVAVMFTLLTMFLLFIVGVVSLESFVLITGVLVLLGMIVLYLAAPYPLMFAIAGTDPDVGLWGMVSHAYQLAKGNRVKIIVTHVVMNIVIGIISNITQIITYVVMIVLGLAFLFILNPLLQAMSVDFGILILIFWLALFIILYIAQQALLTTTFLGSFYGGLHGTIILKEQRRQFPWKQGLIPSLPLGGPASMVHPPSPPYSSSATHLTPSSSLEQRTVKFCRFCGEELPIDSVFCSKCGKKLL